MPKLSLFGDQKRDSNVQIKLSIGEKIRVSIKGDEDAVRRLVGGERRCLSHELDDLRNALGLLARDFTSKLSFLVVHFFVVVIMLIIVAWLPFVLSDVRIFLFSDSIRAETDKFFQRIFS